MRLFSCPSCRVVVYFENVRCERCEAAFGYDPARNRMAVVGELRYCANRAHGVCNWLLPAGDAGELCVACRHNLVIPDLSIAENVPPWTKIEWAKHRLLYTLLRLGLPHPTRTEQEDGLGFEFLADVGPEPTVMTGHANGLITIALAEADDAEREKRRMRLGEAYRTLLGHFRHEVGHWYWDLLVRDTRWREPFVALFGDPDQDYGEALQRHYANGPRPDWQAELISSYAGSHPWEDFAETWAHYLHMVDTLETGGSYRISLTPRLDHEHLLTTSLDFDVFAPTVDVPTLTAAWVALSSALNSFNRSMGLPDAYPFVVAPKVYEKIGFVHDLVREGSGRR